MATAQLSILAAIAPLVLSAVHAQTVSQPNTRTSTKPLVFKSATIQVASEHKGNGVSVTQDGAKASGSPLKWIIRSAYQENRDALWIGEPEWTDTAFYNLQAKFDSTAYKNLTDDQRFAMIQALLADRFKLVVHRETRTLPIYTLVVANGGPKLRTSDALNYTVDNLGKPYCLAGLTNFRQCTMVEFATDASSLFHLDRIVVDGTGLTGRYDFSLRYTPPRPGVTYMPGSGSIFDALPEQIGLSLEPGERSVSVFVIDHVERASDN